MARITAGVACSHVPAIGVAMDTGITDEPYWQPVFKGFEKSREWMVMSQRGELQPVGWAGAPSKVSTNALGPG